MGTHSGCSIPDYYCSLDFKFSGTVVKLCGLLTTAASFTPMSFVSKSSNLMKVGEILMGGGDAQKGTIEDHKRRTEYVSIKRTTRFQICDINLIVRFN